MDYEIIEFNSGRNFVKAKIIGRHNEIKLEFYKTPKNIIINTFKVYKIDVDKRIKEYEY